MVLVRGHTARRRSSDGFLVFGGSGFILYLVAKHKINNNSDDHCANNIFDGRVVWLIVI